jgi:RNA polymerase sigma factor (sigma-70 family)
VVQFALAAQTARVTIALTVEERSASRVKRSDTDVELEALMLRLAAGDRSAFDPLYDAMWPLVQRLTTRMMRGAPEAQDAAQKAMLKLFARASHFEPGRSATTWVLAIAAYECRTLLKRQKRKREDRSEMEALVDAKAGSPETAVIDRDFEAAAREVLGTLRATDIATLEASARGERPDLPQATFRKRLERALARFRAAWSARHGSD